MIKRVFFLLLCLLPGLTAWGGESLSFGIVPQQSAAKLARLWLPLLQELGERSGMTLQFATAPDIPTFEQRLLRGEYDLAYMNPYHYTVFSRLAGYQAFAKEEGKRIQGIIVVRRDSPITSLEMLQGRELAFPAPAAFAASLIPRAYLRREGIAITPQYVGSHDSVYLSVVRGIYPAGGGVVRTLNGVAPEISDQLRILWSSAGYTPHAFAAHPRVDKALVARLTAAMESLGNDKVGRALLETLRLKPLVAASDSDWDAIRALDIQQLEQQTGY